MDGSSGSQPWPGFEKFGTVQTILDHNRLLIHEIKHNHETRTLTASSGTSLLSGSSTRTSPRYYLLRLHFDLNPLPLCLKAWTLLFAHCPILGRSPGSGLTVDRWEWP